MPLSWTVSISQRVQKYQARTDSCSKQVQEHQANASLCASTNNALGCKRQSALLKAPPSKRYKGSGKSEVSDPTDSSVPEGLMTPFEPTSLVKNWEGAFEPPSQMAQYIQKHFKRCVTKEEREASPWSHPAISMPGRQCLRVHLTNQEITDPWSYWPILAHICIRWLLRNQRHALWRRVSDQTGRQCLRVHLTNQEITDPWSYWPILAHICIRWLLRNQRHALWRRVSDQTNRQDGKGNIPGQSCVYYQTTQGKGRQFPRKLRPRSDNFFSTGPAAKYGGREGKSFFPYKHQPTQNGGSRRKL